MTGNNGLKDALAAGGLADWGDTLQPLVDSRLSPAAHGDYARWADVIERLPRLTGDPVALKSALLELSPWRKGPFDLPGVRIDAEWRSDRKWRRLADAIAPINGRTVLDVGCGNGWYAIKMHEAGARFVLGIDPTLLYIQQFQAIQTVRDTHQLKKDTHQRREDIHGIRVLPLRLEELPPEPRAFDTTFSMGVLYHRRSPLDHLAELRDTLRAGGQLVLETIVLPGDDSRAATPPGRYARMKNVWLLPTVPELMTWLDRTRFRDCRLVDVSLTTTDEQRRTEWMSFESLAEALDPDDPGKTIEGWPAPRRAIVTATAP